MCQFAKFHGCIVNGNRFTILTYSEYWAKVPQSNNSIRGISVGGENFHLFQQVKLCQFAKFHGCIVNGNRFTILTYSEYWAQIPPSKNSTRVFFPKCVYILLRPISIRRNFFAFALMKSKKLHGAQSPAHKIESKYFRAKHFKMSDENTNILILLCLFKRKKQRNQKQIKGFGYVNSTESEKAKQLTEIWL